MTIQVRFRRGLLALLVGVATLVPAGAAEQKATGPAKIGDLGLWLVASDLGKTHRDGQPVTRWPDRSGNGYDAIFEGKIPQAEPRTGIHHPPTFKVKALAGQPAVAFDAPGRQTLILNRAGHALGQTVSGFSAAFMVRPTLVYGPAPALDAPWTQIRYLFISHLSNYDTRVSVLVLRDTGEVVLASRPRPHQQITAQSTFAGGRRVAMSGEAWHRLLVTVDYRAKEKRILLDGTLLTEALPAGSADSFEDVPSPITGIASNTLGDWLTCQIAELVAYQKALTVDELRALDTYLQDKYGLPKSGRRTRPGPGSVHRQFLEWRWPYRPRALDAAPARHRPGCGDLPGEAQGLAGRAGGPISAFSLACRLRRIPTIRLGVPLAAAWTSGLGRAPASMEIVATTENLTRSSGFRSFKASSYLAPSASTRRFRAFESTRRNPASTHSRRVSSRIALTAASDFWSDPTERSTATLRTMAPLKPVRPACTEPIALIRKNPGRCGSSVSRTQKARSSAVWK
jgi:hypothetical protein